MLHRTVCLSLYKLIFVINQKWMQKMFICMKKLPMMNLWNLNMTSLTSLPPLSALLWLHQICPLGHVNQAPSYQTQHVTVTLSSTWCRTATTETGWPEYSCPTRWRSSSEPMALPVSLPGQELRPCTRVSTEYSYIQSQLVVIGNYGFFFFFVLVAKKQLSPTFICKSYFTSWIDF